MFVTGLVLAADGSPRLGVPKELLSYQGETLLGASLDTARECGFDQLIVTLGTASEQVRERVDLDGTWVVDSPHADTGSSSIVPALDVVDRRTDGIVVMLGDQPGVTSATVWSLVAEVAGPATPIGVSRYDDGPGHPCWFGRELFGELRQLRSDLDVWGLIRAGRHPITEVDAAGNIPLRVETWEDYQTLVALPDIEEEEVPVVPPAAVPTRGRLARRRSRRPKV
ncbi:NTP transferase domain-containing protein [Kribbella sp. VKM Ac-2568]|uniref:nucleotidyltransferase family protein n=1 Tax=Kribbella sp. VKM Ac-2568 TaxID=2512219 RepID=UPI001045C853|nr:nucleotidyltransferase family protein [Kribbella sp. VKM Ac-2568]TCM47872.1 molybdenum cofactor cytidylyltransferase [Kribbella sp. VKM Ac-2568]